VTSGEIVGILIRWLIIAVSLVVAVWIVPGIEVSDTNAWLAVLVTAAVLGLINTFVRPFLQILSCGCIVLTLGLFLLLINAATLALAAWISENWLHVGFSIDGFWPAFFGALIVSVVSYLLSMLVPFDLES
jgi:putative membrane protein